MNDFTFAPNFLTIYCQDFDFFKTSFSFKYKYKSYLNKYNSLPLFKIFVDNLKNGTTEDEMLLNLNKQNQTWYQELIQDNLIYFNWENQGKILLSIYPVSPTFQWINPSQSRLLSQFAYIHREDNNFVLESPKADCKISNISPTIAARIIASFEETSESNQDTLAQQLFYLLSICNFLEPITQESPQKHWEFHDCLFHYHSTINRPHEPFGTTYPFAQDYPYPHTNYIANQDNIIFLPQPDNEVLNSEFSQILEKRQSSRNHRYPPINIQQISELLFLSCKVKTKFTYYPKEIENKRFKEIELYHKAYPSAGGINELKFYVIINQCEGLTPGVYLYDDLHHGLSHLPKSSKYQPFFLNDASYFWGNPDAKPQILLLIASQLNLLSWKYEKIAYRLSLLNAGCVIQTLYLVARQLNLSCCALGGVNNILFKFLEILKEIEGIPLVQLAIGS